MPWNTVRIAMSADPTSPGTDSYPRESARTQRYTLGEPRDVVVSPDGERIVFLRSRGGTDPVNCLWVVDAASGDERLVGDPEALLGGRDDEDLPTEEKARRERAREGAGGITTFATDRDVRVTAFAIAGRLFVGGLVSGQARELPVAGPVFDPRPDPARPARRLRQRSPAVHRRARRLVARAGRRRGRRAGVDHVGQRRLHRRRGDGPLPWLLVEPGRHRAWPSTRVDTAPVQRWHLGDPADPATEPRELPYPAAGTPNAEVTLHVIALDGSIVDVEWDRDQLPYLADVRWSDAGLIATVQSRDQRAVARAAGRPRHRRHRGRLRGP